MLSRLESPSKGDLKVSLMESCNRTLLEKENEEQKTYQYIIKEVDTLSKILPTYISENLKTEVSLKIICTFMKRGKDIREAVLLLPCCIKYLMKESTDAFAKLEKEDSFQNFVDTNYRSILEIASEKRVQSNLFQRCLPIIEVLSKKIGNASLTVVELGSSYGLIGYGLLDPFKMMQQKELFFPQSQQMPSSLTKATRYLGIDIGIPSEDWALSCIIPTGDEEKFTRNFIKEMKPEKYFNLIEASCFGFSDLKDVKELNGADTNIIILTSFMLYQFDKESQTKISEEIYKYIKTVKGHWINLDFKTPGKPETCLYWDGGEVMRFSEENRCRGWKWTIES